MSLATWYLSAIDLPTLGVFLHYVTTELVIEQNAQSPNLLENMVTILNSRWNVQTIVGRLFKIGLEVTVGCFKNAFTSGCPLAIHALRQNSDDKVKGQLKYTIPNALQLLLRLNSNGSVKLAGSNLPMLSDCIKFVVDCGIAVTLDDLKSALELNEPFVVHHFIRHLNFKYIKQVKALFPNILVRVLDQCAHIDMSYGPWLVDLVKYLLAWFDIDVNFADSSLGTELFVKKPSYSDVFLEILQYVLKQKGLDIDGLKMIQRDGGQPEKARTEMSPLDCPLNHQLIEVVNFLIVAGASHHGIDVISKVKGHKS